MKSFASRQVHLDFHTSEKIADVATHFDKTQFQQAIQLANLNSITIFGKCHHGYCYYPTQVGTQHPTMPQGMDLAGQMMDACHEIGVRAPFYITLGWSALDAIEHPEWVVRDVEGNMCGANYDVNAKPTDPKPQYSWQHLCCAGGYRDYLYRMTEEVCQRYDTLDGLFYDIVFVYDTCHCAHCKETMLAKGYDCNNEADAKKSLAEERSITLNGIKDILKKYHPDATIFFNSGGAEVHKPEWHSLSTHYELEDLPTSWGGYDKMPMRAKYFGGKGKPYLGMTGKFHVAWGEFGGYKLPEALKYECASMLTWGARISVGDQLHPLGMMDLPTYQNIGEAYRYVAQIEQFCFDVTETSKLGVIIDTAKETYNSTAKLLLDCHLDFDIIRTSDKVVDFEVIIVEENMPLNEEWAAAINVHIAQGGKLLMLGGSCLNAEGTAFAIDLPLTYQGISDYHDDYLEVSPAIAKDMITSPIYCYSAAHVVNGEGVSLAKIRAPYFNRTYNSYCSHANAPYGLEQEAYPAAIQTGNVIYLAHEIATMYHDYGSAYHRRYFENIVNLLYPQRNVTVALPAAARLRFVEQPQEKRYILHLLFALPMQREHVCVLEDFPTLRQVPVTARVEKPIKQVILQPQNLAIDFIQEQDEVRFTVPEVTMHQLITFTY
ncbi:MAG: hypothetical protein R3Y06_06110 [Faecalibacterium sp.]